MHPAYRALDLIPVDHVNLQRDRSAFEPGNFLDDFFCAGKIEIENRHVGAISGQAQANAATNPRGATRDHRHFPVKTHLFLL
jgi:hypothetical protein